MARRSMARRSMARRSMTRRSMAHRSMARRSMASVCVQNGSAMLLRAMLRGLLCLPAVENARCMPENDCVTTNALSQFTSVHNDAHTPRTFVGKISPAVST